MLNKEVFYMDIEESEELFAKIKVQNKQYLFVFEEDLKAEHLKTKIINKHLDIADFYINVFLLREKPLEMTSGCENIIDSFLGNFLIQKVMWSLPYSIKSIVTSVKKFYKTMMKYGYIEEKKYLNLCDDIKKLMPKWLFEWESYNDFGNLDSLDF